MHLLRGAQDALDKLQAMQNYDSCTCAYIYGMNPVHADNLYCTLVLTTSMYMQPTKQQQQKKLQQQQQQKGCSSSLSTSGTVLYTTQASEQAPVLYGQRMFQDSPSGDSQPVGLFLSARMSLQELVCSTAELMHCLLAAATYMVPLLGLTAQELERNAMQHC